VANRPWTQVPILAVGASVASLPDSVFSIMEAWRCSPVVSQNHYFDLLRWVYGATLIDSMLFERMK